MDRITAEIRALSRPLEAVPAGCSPRLEVVPGIRAVIFDVYGTLVISGSGDITIARERPDGDAVMREVLATACRAAGRPPPENPTERFFALIDADHRDARERGTICPEVEIRAIWRRLLESAGISQEVTEEQLEEMAVRYECGVNPVWPMPGAAETLGLLQDRGLALGIVSNAQFFTPRLFPALFGAELGAIGFAGDLCVWSFREGEAKPSPRLFEQLACALRLRGWGPDEALYVGNDMRNDVAAAAAAGLRTALFAGDARSLRLRQGEPSGAVRPDAVITALPQLAAVLAAGSAGK